jgi:aminopeptidase N
MLLCCTQAVYSQGQSLPAVFDATYYRIEIRIDTLQKKAFGRVDIDLTLCSYPAERIALDLTDAAVVDSVYVNGFPAGHLQRNGKLIVALGGRYNHIRKISVRCVYAVPFTENGIDLVYWKGALTLHTYGLPYTAKEWWPCNDLPSDKADSADILVTAPSPLTVVSNGKLVEVKAIQPGDMREQQFHWKVSYPIYPDVISIAVCDYSRFEIHTAAFPFYFYVFKQDLEKAKMDFAVLPSMLRSHEHYFGPYPFAREKYGVAEFARESYREHQTIPSLGYNYISGQHTADRVLAHELAHQWFGNSLSVKNWKHVWLNESFCNYAYALWAERECGEQGYRDVMKKFDRPDFSGPVLLSDSLYVEAMFTPTTFCKGAWLLHMLRHVMGDIAFFKAIKEYAVVYRYKTVETINFQQVCEQYYHHSLGWFFDEWLLGTDRPEYSASFRCTKQQKKVFVLVTLVQKQSGNLVYSMPVDMTFILKNGNIIQKKIWNNRRRQDYRIALDDPVDRVIIDPADDILKKTAPVTN